MDDLIADFLTETNESIADLDVALVKLERTPDDKDTLSLIFRLVHTIKGTCGFLGLPRLERVAHAGENVLGKVRDGVLTATPDTVTLVLAGLDRIKLIVTGLAATGSEPAGDDSELIDALNAAAAGEAPKPAVAAAPEPEEEPSPEVVAAPVPEEMPAPPPAPAPVQAATEAPPGEPVATNQTIRVTVDVLEDLMTLVSELVLTRNQLLQLARTQENNNFTVPLQRLSHITSDLQEGDQASRFRKLQQLLQVDNPTVGSDHQAWIHAAMRWAEIVAVRWSLPEHPPTEDVDRFQDMHQLIEQNFQNWMIAHYGSLPSLSFLPRPVMAHQIPRYMGHRLAVNGTTRKMAVVIVDGLAMDQWAVVRQEMPPRKWLTAEFGLFAWVPTLTSVSRQSIFAGDPPFYFGQSLDTTGKEEQHWTRFWEDHGVRRGEAAYACQGIGEEDGAFTRRVMERIDQPRCCVAGIVVGTIDQMLHGIVTGTDGMHAGVRHWARRGALWSLFDALLERGFEVILTADHGNVEGVGIGKPNVGVTAGERGERVHVFSDTLLRSAIADRFRGSIAWPTIGLPDDYFALIAPPRRAFIGEGRRTVAHGGVCIEEVIVPFIMIGRSEW